MAGNLQYQGDTSLKFGALTVRFSPKGMTTHFTVSSPSVGALIGYYNYIVQFGASGEFFGADSGEIRELHVEVPGLTSTTAGVLSELFFDQWELLTNENSASIFENPIIVGGTTPLVNYNDKVILSRMARLGTTATKAIGACNADVGMNLLAAPTPGQGGALVNGYYQFGPLTSTAAAQLGIEIQKGQIEYDRPTYVLRHTSYCSAGALYNPSTAYAQFIYSPAQILTEIGSGWTYNCPPRLYSKVSAASAAVQYAAPEEAYYYSWGWLKKITRENVLANFMVEISTEYELNLWSNLRYYHR